VTGEPVDAVIVGGRANDEFSARTTISDSRFLGGRRNVVSVVGAIGLRFERNVVSGGNDTYPSPTGGNPGAGIDIEPNGRGDPVLDVELRDNTIADNAGPGILLALTNHQGLPVLADGLRIVGNRILRNGTRSTPPQHGGIVVNGGQDAGGGRLLVAANEIAGNRHAAISLRWDVGLEVEQRDNRISGAIRRQLSRPE
jgi:hypothetical protein